MSGSDDFSESFVGCKGAQGVVGAAGEGGSVDQNAKPTATLAINALGDNMSRLLKDQHLTDVHLLCGSDEKVIRAHRFVLAATSPVFSAMFTTAGMSETESPHIVRIPDIHPLHMQLFLQLLYCGSVSDCSDEHFDCIMPLSEIAGKYRSQFAADRIWQLAEIHSLRCLSDDELSLSTALDIVRLYGCVCVLQSSFDSDRVKMPKHIFSPLLRFIASVWQKKVVEGHGLESLFLMEKLLEAVDELKRL